MKTGIASIALLALVVLAGCSKDEDGSGTLIIKLTDAPAAYNEVNVEVTDVAIHTAGFGWTSVNVPDSVYDLLVLQDSALAVLDTATIAAGKISQIRLILGSQNTVKVDTVIYPLSLSSQDETGLKLNVHQDIVAGQTYTLVIDFDANASVVEQGNGNYRLKPALSASFK